jgi:hypothetical protein
MGENPTEEDGMTEMAAAAVAFGALIARKRMIAAEENDHDVRTMMSAVVDLVNAAGLITLASQPGQLDLSRWDRYLPAPTREHVLAAIITIAYRMPPTVKGVDILDEWLTQVLDTLGRPAD